MTLVELLVVVTILMILTVVALPAVTPSAESRRIREAARSLNVLLGAARNRAMETGRPQGVVFRVEQGLRQARVFQAEVPPPYAGEDVTSKVRVVQLPGTWPDGRSKYQATTVGGFNSSLVNVGDLMQLNDQGPMYEIMDASLGLAVNLSAAYQCGNPPWTTTPSMPVSYKIYRRPVPTLAAPLNLPRNTVVDMAWSGGANAGVQADAFGRTLANGYPVIVMFSPKGEVHQVWCCNAGGTFKGWPGTDVLYFLVGRQDRVPTTVGGASPADDGLSNWEDTGNLWVTVTPQTGLIKTIEVARVSTGTWVDSRRFAVTGQSMGGK